jgi:hypothetical protein
MLRWVRSNWGMNERLGEKKSLKRSPGGDDRLALELKSEHIVVGSQEKKTRHRSI